MALVNGLTIKQQRFVNEYVANGGNGTRAAIQAGYSEDTASEMAYENLNKPHIKQAIEAYEQAIATKCGITAEYVIQSIHELAIRARDNDDIQQATKNYELLGKTLKIFTDKIESTQTIDANINSNIDLNEAARMIDFMLAKGKAESEIE